VTASPPRDKDLSNCPSCGYSTYIDFHNPYDANEPLECWRECECCNWVSDVWIEASEKDIDQANK